MDSESCIDQTSKTNKCSQHLEVDPSLEPVTPDTNKENVDFTLDVSSPLTALIKPPDTKNGPLASVDNPSSPQTPKDGVFDPFAPGPEDKVCAPQCKKYSHEARVSAARCLDFSSSKMGNITHILETESISDEEMFESVYENLLEAIISKQTEDALAEISNVEWDSHACRTPPSAPRLTRLAETCPGAPQKPTGKSRNIDSGLCRKLDF